MAIATTDYGVSFLIISGIDLRKCFLERIAPTIRQRAMERLDELPREKGIRIREGDIIHL